MSPSERELLRHAAPSPSRPLDYAALHKRVVVRKRRSRALAGTAALVLVVTAAAAFAQGDSSEPRPVALLMTTTTTSGSSMSTPATSSDTTSTSGPPAGPAPSSTTTPTTYPAPVDPGAVFFAIIGDRCLAEGARAETFEGVPVVCAVGNNPPYMEWRSVASTSVVDSTTLLPSCRQIAQTYSGVAIAAFRDPLSPTQVVCWVDGTIGMAPPPSPSNPNPAPHDRAVVTVRDDGSFVAFNRSGYRSSMPVQPPG